MSPYGHKRYDTLKCHYGCCTSKYGKEKDARKASDRSRRKTARQSSNQQIFTQLIHTE